jgi:DNA-binding CsgD family transcriptional regulator
MREFLPVVLAASEKHWEDLALNFSTPNDAESKNAHGQRLAAALSEFGKGLLTPREREVVEFTLKGHSAAAVGHIMGISPGTVRIHRRNIYSKLRIRSQGELFSGFIEAMLKRPD